MKDGVYKILCKVNNKVCIGSALNIKAKRWSKYKSELNRGRYKNKSLQADWTKFGADAFEFTMIEECTENRREREQYWKKYYEEQGFELYNSNNIVTTTVKQKTEEEKRKTHENMSKVQSGENNPRCCKLTSEDVKEIKIYQRDNTYRDRELAKMYNVSLSLINHIRRGERWASVIVEEKEAKSIGVEVASPALDTLESAHA